MQVIIIDALTCTSEVCTPSACNVFVCAQAHAQVARDTLDKQHKEDNVSFNREGSIKLARHTTMGSTH